MREAIEQPSLDALALIRNMLAHNNGVIDREFMDKSGKLPQLANLCSKGEGAIIQVDGIMVRDLVAPVISTAGMLLTAVDAWLTSHPTPG